MKFLSNMHMHTTFSDGVNTPEECVLAAIAKGFVSLGISEHSYYSQGLDYTMSIENYPLYGAEMERLKKKYEDKIQLYMGLELDYGERLELGDLSLDFTIGSVHYLVSPHTGRHYSLDDTAQTFEQAIADIGGGTPKGLVQAYYNTVCAMAKEFSPDVIGHFDVIEKLNKNGRFFDSNSDWYLQIATEAIEVIAKTGKIVELNSGGMHRGYTTKPYPYPQLLQVMCEKGIHVTISSDAHNANSVDYYFEEMLELLAKTGYKSVQLFQNGRYGSVDLFY